MRAKLLKHRTHRVRPGFDDKLLADWNGLTIAALANAASAFDRPDWLDAAEAAFAFIRTKMTSKGRLLHAYREGKAKAPATGNDYANMIRAALALANATGKRATPSTRRLNGPACSTCIIGQTLIPTAFNFDRYEPIFSFRLI